AEGRRPPGVLGLARQPDDRALLRRPARGGPRQRQAARLTRPPRDRVPARAAAAALPRDAARLRRAPVVPEPDEGPGRGRLLDRLGRPRLGGTALRRAGRPLRRVALRPRHGRPLHLAARRRGARRGEPLGGRARTPDEAARERALDRRPEPPEPRPG